MNHREYQYLEPEVWIAEVLHLLSLEEFTELLNECAPYALITPLHFFVSLSAAQDPGALRGAAEDP